MTDLWTLRRATLVGSLAGLVALLLWPAFVFAQTPWRLPFTLALAITAFSGASILAFTLWDMATVARGRRVRPARAFDLALGALLALPSALALGDLLA